MGCLRGSKFTLYFMRPRRKTGFPENLRDVSERACDNEPKLVGDSPIHHLRPAIAKPRAVAASMLSAGFDQ